MRGSGSNKAVVASVVCVVLLLGLVPTAQQPPEPIAPTPTGEAQAPVAAETVRQAEGLERDEQAEEHHGGLADLLWPTVNFLILAGALWYFLRTPLAVYLRDRHAAIRRDLVEAADLKAAATATLADIDRKLQALPGEIDALKRRAAEEIAADEQRIAAMAAAERERLLEQARREIDLQVRLARRELVEHAADLAVQLATNRLRDEITPGDQRRLVERYVNQLGQGPGQ